MSRKHARERAKQRRAGKFATWIARADERQIRFRNRSRRRVAKHYRMFLKRFLASPMPRPWWI